MFLEQAYMTSDFRELYQVESNGICFLAGEAEKTENSELKLKNTRNQDLWSCSKIRGMAVAIAFLASNSLHNHGY